jgi:choline dehydrogenase-like flavoprotein
MAQITDIADAVVTALNGQSFSQPFTAARAYRPAFDLREMKDLHVTVVPKGVELTTAGRGLAQSDVQIDIGVQQKLATGDDAEIDAFVRSHAETALHPSCTCKMGTADDPMAVVDNEGRVHGLEGLRVVDASIMPRIVTGNLNAPTIMIAEKIADRMRGVAPLARSDAAFYVAGKSPLQAPAKALIADELVTP